jgi:hypothetical protein
MTDMDEIPLEMRQLGVVFFVMSSFPVQSRESRLRGRRRDGGGAGELGPYLCPSFVRPVPPASVK